jgi:predicted dehydrogenase
VPERFKWVPEALRSGPAYDVGQMWVKFAETIRTGSNALPSLPDFDHAVRRHRLLDTIVRASQTGQRQKVML